MEGFGLLIGHLLGDFVFQNDWMASNKTNPHPGPEPGEDGLLRRYTAEHRAWQERCAACVRGDIACTVHCLLYTLAVWACSFWWMPVWGPAAVFLAHWPVDRFRLAGWWMRNVSGQSFFASKEHPLFPWSVVVVDNTFHLLTLFVIMAADAIAKPA